MIEFDDKVVLISGGSGGIGQACAAIFAKYGARVALFDQHRTALEESRSLISRASRQEVVIIIGDIQNEHDCENAIIVTVQKFGRLDYLVNSADVVVFDDSIESINKSRHLSQHEMSSECLFVGLDLALAVNVKGPLMLMHFAAPHLADTRGAIVNVSSYSSLRVVQGFVSYQVSKACLDHLTQFAAKELAPKGIRVNCVNPGPVDTPIQIRSGITPAEEVNYIDCISKLEPYGYVQSPLEVAEAIAFLAGGRSPFVNGVILPLDCGCSNGFESYTCSIPCTITDP